MYAFNIGAQRLVLSSFSFAAAFTGSHIHHSWKGAR
jgi:hypothetical protein